MKKLIIILSSITLGSPIVGYGLESFSPIFVNNTLSNDSTSDYVSNNATISVGQSEITSVIGGTINGYTTTYSFTFDKKGVYFLGTDSNMNIFPETFFTTNSGVDGSGVYGLESSGSKLYIYCAAGVVILDFASYYSSVDIPNSQGATALGTIELTDANGNFNISGQAKGINTTFDAGYKKAFGSDLPFDSSSSLTFSKYSDYVLFKSNSMSASFKLIGDSISNVTRASSVKDYMFDLGTTSFYVQGSAIYTNSSIVSCFYGSDITKKYYPISVRGDIWYFKGENSVIIVPTSDINYDGPNNRIVISNAAQKVDIGEDAIFAHAFQVTDQNNMWSTIVGASGNVYVVSSGTSPFVNTIYKYNSLPDGLWSIGYVNGALFYHNTSSNGNLLALHKKIDIGLIQPDKGKDTIDITDIVKSSSTNDDLLINIWKKFVSFDNSDTNVSLRTMSAQVLSEVLKANGVDPTNIAKSFPNGTSQFSKITLNKNNFGKVFKNAKDIILSSGDDTQEQDVNKIVSTGISLKGATVAKSLDLYESDIQAAFIAEINKKYNINNGLNFKITSISLENGNGLLVGKNNIIISYTFVDSNNGSTITGTNVNSSVDGIAAMDLTITNSGSGTTIDKNASVSFSVSDLAPAKNLGLNLNANDVVLSTTATVPNDIRSYFNIVVNNDTVTISYNKSINQDLVLNVGVNIFENDNSTVYAKSSQSLIYNVKESTADQFDIGNQNGTIFQNASGSAQFLLTPTLSTFKPDISRLTISFDNNASGLRGKVQEINGKLYAVITGDGVSTKKGNYTFFVNYSNDSNYKVSSHNVIIEGDRLDTFNVEKQNEKIFLTKKANAKFLLTPNSNLFTPKLSDLSVELDVKATGLSASIEQDGNKMYVVITGTPTCPNGSYSFTVNDKNDSYYKSITTSFNVLPAPVPFPWKTIIYALVGVLAALLIIGLIIFLVIWFRRHPIVKSRRRYRVPQKTADSNRKRHFRVAPVAQERIKDSIITSGLFEREINVQQDRMETDDYEENFIGKPLDEDSTVLNNWNSIRKDEKTKMSKETKQKKAENEKAEKNAKDRINDIKKNAKKHKLDEE